MFSESDYSVEDGFHPGFTPASGNNIARRPVPSTITAPTEAESTQGDQSHHISQNAEYQVSPPASLYDEVSPVAAPTMDWSTHRESRGPFMHYEDLDYLEPPPETSNARGVREPGAGAPPPGSNPRRKTLWRRRERREPSILRILRSWLPEVLWTLVSIACLIAIAVVLKLYDGQPLPNWPLGITLNTLVAFLSTLCRAAFIVPVMEGLSQLKWNWFATGDRSLADFQAFDDASRGPYGSLKLLLTTRGRVLGITAAVVLLTGLVTSPLTQSLISYPTRYGPGNGTATAPRSELYSYSDVVVTATENLDIRQKQAVQQGIFNPVNESFPLVEPLCSSGDCTWPSFGSLAVCVAMNDVSNLLTISKSLNGSSVASSLGLPSDVPLHNATLPNGVFLVGGAVSYNLNMSTSPFLASANSIILDPSANNWAPANQTLSFTGQTNLTNSAIANFFVVYTDQTQQFAPDSESFRAAELLLHFCVNTYSVGVAQGVAGTEQTATATRVLSTNGTIDFLGQPLAGQVVLTDDDGAANYSVNPAYARALGTYATFVFSGTYSAAYGSAAPGLTSASDALGTALFGEGSSDGHDGDGEMRHVIANMTQNVATSLTNVIRTLGTTEVGTAYAPETYVSIRWPWLAFLASQVVLSGLFLAAVMAQTWWLGVRVLKSSALATLLAVTSEDKRNLERERLDRIGDPRDMGRNAAQLAGTMRLENRGWMLRVARRYQRSSGGT